MRGKAKRGGEEEGFEIKRHYFIIFSNIDAVFSIGMNNFARNSKIHIIFVLYATKDTLRTVNPSENASHSLIVDFYSTSKNSPFEPNLGSLLDQSDFLETSLTI